MTVDWAIAYCRANDHKLPGETAVQGPLDREAMRVLWREVERLRLVAAELRARLGEGE